MVTIPPLSPGRASKPTPEAGDTALEQFFAGAFPDWWTFVPVHGKATYIKNWSTNPLDRDTLLEEYNQNPSYNGLGVLTGQHSGGLLAIDIDGPAADERFRQQAGDAYEAFGEESTMSWTSGKPGRRQILYRLPTSFVKQLFHVNALILREDGSWHLGTGDKKRQGEKVGDKNQHDYEEVVLRFNKLQSVVPGSTHPETGRYRWLNYNEGNVEIAPDWILDVFAPHQQPVAWLSREELLELENESASTALPASQIRGWFFKDEVQSLLRPRLEDLIFNHPVFDNYGWKTRDGDNPQRMSGCPWHGGSSGTSFQYSTISGCWHCKACDVGGDVLDFVHKIKSDDLYAGKPPAQSLEAYVARITTELGFNYPADANIRINKNIEIPQVTLSTAEFFAGLIKIEDEELNPGDRLDRMAQFASSSGRRYTGLQCIELLNTHKEYKRSLDQNAKPWYETCSKFDYTIPGLLQKPSQVLLHAAGGLGKTSACLALARAVGRCLSMTVRGITVDVPQGNVLWIQNDQSTTKLMRDCEDNGIDPLLDKWFIVKRSFQLDHTHVLESWIKEYKPALVVVDSIGSCSNQMVAQEKDKAFAAPFYLYAQKNGDLELGFPATTFIWIHHDNAQGEARGSRQLVAAIDEQWHLRKLTDDERDNFRGKGRSASNLRMIQIKKSRSGREGDRLIVERDQDFAYSLWDYTPTLRRDDGGNGDPDPHTLVLEIIKEHAKQTERADQGKRVSRTAKEVWEELVPRLTGLGLKAPNQRTVTRWMNRWVEEQILALGEMVVVGKTKALTYTLPYTKNTHTRARCPLEAVICPALEADPLQDNGLAHDKTQDKNQDVQRSTPESGETGLGAPKTPRSPAPTEVAQVLDNAGQQPEPDEFCPALIDCAADEVLVTLSKDTVFQTVKGDLQGSVGSTPENLEIDCTQTGAPSQPLAERYVDFDFSSLLAAEQPVQEQDQG